MKHLIACTYLHLFAMIIKDITQSWDHTNGSIIDVNGGVY